MNSHYETYPLHGLVGDRNISWSVNIQVTPELWDDWELDYSYAFDLSK